MHLTYSVGSLLPYNNFSTINVNVTLFWLLGNAFVIVCSHANVQNTSHTCTGVRECFKGDEENQWKKPKFDPRHTKTP